MVVGRTVPATIVALGNIEPQISREETLAADGRSAEGRFPCVVDSETLRPLGCTPAQMAHAQGEGMIRASARKVLLAEYVKAESGWAIRRIGFEPA